jgi:hypothetical protein
MRSFRPSRAICAAMFIVGVAAASSAFGHGGVRFGFAFGFPGYYPAPYYYPPPPVYYYPPPVVVAPAAPPVYIERGQAQAAPGDQYWYFCPDTRAYYPYVQNCASAWQRVVPRPPGS